MKFMQNLQLNKKNSIYQKKISAFYKKLSVCVKNVDFSKNMY